MSIRDRLKIAYENVAYSADKTWRAEYFNLQKSHMDLFLKESQLQLPTNLELRPRTVRDCIPNSKLARYSNYEYSYSRELSYNMDNVNLPSNRSSKPDKDSEKEPWMLEQVDQLFRFYTNQLSYRNDNNRDIHRIYTYNTYESPFLKTSSLSEYFLKLQITNSQVKKIWDVRSKDCEYFLRSSSVDDPFLLQKSTKQVFLSDYGKPKKEFNNEVFDWHRSNQVGVNNINTFTTQSDDKVKIQSEVNSIQHKRLYSAVLQGFSTTKIPGIPVENRMTILKRNLTKNNMEKLNSINELTRTKIEDTNECKTMEDTNSVKRATKADCSPKSANNLTTKHFGNSTKNGVGAIYNPLYTMNHLQSQLEGLNQQNRLLSNSFFTSANLVTNPPIAPRFRQAYASSNCQYPSFYMFIQNTLQQQNFLQPLYNPMVLHRSSPINIDRNVPQRTLHMPVNSQFVTPHLGNIAQYKTNQSQKTDCSNFKQKVRTKLENIQERKEVKSSGLISLVNVRKISDISSCSSCNSTSKQDTNNENSYEDLEKLVLTSIDMVLEDSISEPIAQVTESSSERLERQALEQYQSSYDNVFLELERQAAEEYEDCPENYKDPPNLEILFGGFFIQCHFFISLWISILNI